MIDYLTTFPYVDSERIGATGICALRHTFATRLSAGGVAHPFVNLMLRQGDAGVFKRYSQPKLNMMREALDRLDGRANEHERSSGTARPN